jgi:hypothetical protein
MVIRMTFDRGGDLGGRTGFLAWLAAAKAGSEAAARTQAINFQKN